MKIGIDIRPLMSGKISGVEVYMKHLLNTLFELDQNNQYYLYYNNNRDLSGFLPKFNYPQVQIVKTAVPNKIFNLLTSLIRYPKLDQLICRKCQIDKLDLFWVPDPRPTPVSNQCVKITTFHDLSFEHFKNTFSWKTKLWHKILKPAREAKESKMIIAVSEATKQDLVSTYKLDEEGIKVVYEGVGEGMKQITDNRILSHLKTKYSLPEQFLLSISTIEPRKNLKGLIKAFRQWKEENSNNYKLVIAGKVNSKIFAKVDILRENSDVKFIGFVAEEDKAGILSLAEGLCYPSFYEGFGLPIVEAFACGTPVLTSNRSSMAEIAQAAAVLVDPYNLKSIKTGLTDLTNKKNILIERGFEKLKIFNWKNSAQAVLNLFQNIG